MFCNWLHVVLPASFLLLGVATSFSAESTAIKPLPALKGLPLVFSDDFESGSVDRWEPTDPDAWKLVRHDKNQAYSLQIHKSNFVPPAKSPFNRSLVKNLELRNLVLDVKLQSTFDTGGHRDLCLFFGYQDDSHFYYVHLAGKTDERANQIFIVNDEARKKISTKTTLGTPWTDGWHRARVVRDVDLGKIEIYFDDMQTPAMVAVDHTFSSGRVGIGSFDDKGNFDDVVVYGEVLKK